MCKPAKLGTKMGFLKVISLKTERLALPCGLWNCGQAVLRLYAHGMGRLDTCGLLKLSELFKDRFTEAGSSECVFSSLSIGS